VLFADTREGQFAQPEEGRRQAQELIAAASHRIIAGFLGAHAATVGLLVLASMPVQAILSPTTTI
jgi:hypothetical protein